jgi:hypothetical protein
MARAKKVQTCKREGCEAAAKDNSKYCPMHAEIARAIALEDWKAKKEEREPRTREEIVAEIEARYKAIVPAQTQSPVAVTPKITVTVGKVQYPPAVDKNGIALTGEKLWKFVLKEAEKQANLTAKAVKPTPMIVQAHVNMLDDNSPVAQSWHVAGGVCGMSWVEFTRANTGFTRWLIKTKKGYKGYRGGCQISIHVNRGSPLTQSYEINMACARDYAEVVSYYLPNEKCGANGRLD